VLRKGSCSICGTRRVIVKRHEHIWYGIRIGHQSYLTALDVLPLIVRHHIVSNQPCYEIGIL
jgi:hypothetical protein